LEEYIPGLKCGDPIIRRLAEGCEHLMIWPVVLAVILGFDYDGMSVRLRCETGEAFLDQGLLEQAEYEFREALEASPGYPDALLGLGRVYTIRGAWVPAEASLRSYLEARPGDARGLRELAVVLLGTDRAAEAAGSALAAASAEPDDPGSWILAGRAAAIAGDTATATTSLGRAVALGGDGGLEAGVLLASILLARHDEETATAILQNAADLGYAPACWRLGRLFVSWGDYARGTALVSTALSISPGGEFADSAAILLDSLASTGRYLVPLVGEE
jgi:protein O-GlcNAc transferase